MGKNLSRILFVLACHLLGIQKVLTMSGKEVQTDKELTCDFECDLANFDTLAFGQVSEVVTEALLLAPSALAGKSR